ncbi:hypothetical protein HYFRA_00003724 [Hymenoscyphus fraxineus]|uniref:Pentatricopeptide repeat domain-containing protein n=1 Tax=Hymenoscyphus fraxineus TaxID=746836 RepID=A0A9N9L128_9HELO|nr:hypothetical protein HYFRA_00003724 [Hymenoscyphus fraxineus]
MQSLWSRTAQIRSSCHCSSCLHSTIALGRRTTTAGIRRRKPTAGEFITACYSSILATAALADARVKEERLKAWDQAIADVKAGKPVTNIPEPSMKDQVDNEVTNWPQIVEGLKNEFNPESAPRQATNHEYATEPELDPARKSGTLKLDGRINKYSYAQRRQFEPLSSNGGNDANAATWNSLYSAWNANIPESVETAILTSDALMSEDSVAGPEMSREMVTRIEPRAPTNDVHLRKMEAMIRRLVDQMMDNSKLACLSQDGLTARGTPWPGETGEIAQLLIDLRNRFVQSPIYSWKSDIEVVKERIALHSAMKQLFSKVNPGEQDSIRTAVAKVCYNLLVTSAPPNVETYSILIKELTRLQQHQIAQVAVDSLLDDSKMVLDDNTVKLILDHYIAKRDNRGFRSVIQRMRGVNPKGKDMHVKRKLLWQVAEEQAVQEWALSPDTKLCHRNGYLMEKYPRSPPVFDSLIRGWLLFDGLRSGARTFRAAIREAQYVYPQTLPLLIDRCVTTRDYQSGVKLLQAMLMYWDDGRTKSALSFDQVTRLAIRRLLVLCGIKPDGDLKPVLHPYLSWASLRSMMEYIETQALADCKTMYLSNEQTSVVDQPENLTSSDTKQLRYDTSPVEESSNMSISKSNELESKTFEPGSVQEAADLLRKFVLMKYRINERETGERQTHMDGTAKANANWIFTANEAVGSNTQLTRLFRNILINSIEARIAARARWISATAKLIESTIDIIKFYNRRTIKTIGASFEGMKLIPIPQRLDKITTYEHKKSHRPIIKVLRVKSNRRDRHIVKKGVMNKALRSQLRRFRLRRSALTPTPLEADIQRLVEKRDEIEVADLETRDRLDSQLSTLLRSHRKELLDEVVETRLELAKKTLQGQSKPVEWKGLRQLKHEKHPRLQIRYHPVVGKEEKEGMSKEEKEGMSKEDIERDRMAYEDLMGE